DGTPVDSLANMRPADIWMITTPDRYIADSCRSVAASDLLRTGDIVFHCSGSMTSTEFAPASGRGSHVASVHPLKTFADPRDAVRTFTGTHCVIEGDGAALEVLEPAFERIGGRISQIDPKFKTVYH